MKSNLTQAAIAVGMVLIAIGILMPLFVGLDGLAFRYTYAAGAVILLIGRLFSEYVGDNMRIKRLHRLEKWSAIFFCVAAFMLFYSTVRDAIVLTLAGAVIQIYSTVMIGVLTGKQ